MPASLPFESTTGSLPMPCVFIIRAAPGMVASGRTVMADLLISVPAVSAAGCGCGRQRPGVSASSRDSRAALSSAASKSDSVTTPTTCRPIISTGTPPILCSVSRRAISWYGVIRSTVTTDVVITSPTRRAHRLCRDLW